MTTNNLLTWVNPTIASNLGEVVLLAAIFENAPELYVLVVPDCLETRVPAANLQSIVGFINDEAAIFHYDVRVQPWR